MDQLRVQQELLVRRALGVSDYVVDQGRALRAKLFKATWPQGDFERDEKYRKVVESILGSLESLPPEFLDGVLGGWQSVDDAASQLRNAAAVTSAEEAFLVAKTLLEAVVSFADESPRKGP